jgi:hypothetical protein
MLGWPEPPTVLSRPIGIMRLKSTSRLSRRLLLALVCVGLLAGGTTWYLATSGPRDRRVAESSESDGWKTIHYRGVQVDIPAGWPKTNVENCEFKWERWAPADTGECQHDGGVAFYGSATFDPQHGPGIRRTEPDSASRPGWGGYVVVGDWAVYVSDDDRAVVQRMLQSTR